MKYNEKYDRWVTKSGLVYRYDSKQDKLVLCKEQKKHDYLYVKVGKAKCTSIRIHRMVWETFNGEIPQGYEIDHFDTNKENNNLDNLRLVTHKENMNNPKTRERISESQKGNNYAKGKVSSEFGRKFKEHYGITYFEDIKLYWREYYYYKIYGKCRWE